MSTQRRSDSRRIASNDARTGRFFALYALVGEASGTLSVYIRLQRSKHYELYERKSFSSAAAAGRFLQSLEPSAVMYVIDPFFK